MHIVAYLSPEVLDRFRASISDVHAVSVAGDAAELHRLLQTTDVEALVVDPAYRHGLYADAVETALARHPQLSVVAYMTLTPVAVRLLLRLARLGVQHVILRGVDDDRQSMLELMNKIPDSRVSALMLRQLESSLEVLPCAVQRAICLLLASPDRVKQAGDLAAAAGMTRRSLNRHMTAAGLQPRQLVSCARLLRAYILLRAPGSRVKEVGARLGYEAQSLNALFVLWTGRSATQVRDSLSAESLVEFLAKTLAATRRYSARFDFV